MLYLSVKSFRFSVKSMFLLLVFKTYNLILNHNDGLDGRDFELLVNPISFHVTDLKKKKKTENRRKTKKSVIFLFRSVSLYEYKCHLCL